MPTSAPPQILSRPLQGRRILVVEDDTALAADLCRGLADLGATIVGPAPTPFYAISLLGRRGVDAAVLDIHLYRTDVFEVAKELMARKIPMIFASADPLDVLPAPYRHCPIVQKPIDPRQVQAILAQKTLAPAQEKTAPPSDQSSRPGDRLMRAVVRSLRLPN